MWSTILRRDLDLAAPLGVSPGSCAKSAVSHSVIRAPASLAARGDVVFEPETELYLCAAGYWLAADCWKICILFGKLDRILACGGLPKF